MDEAGIDVLLATSKHNVQYLLGGHRSFFFDYMDAIGLSRYLPVVVYPKGAPDKAAYFGHRMESFQTRGQAVLDARGATRNSSGSVDAMQKAIDYLRKSGVKAKRHRRRDCRSCRWTPATTLRRTHSPTARSRTRCSCWSGCARKTPEELEKLQDRLRAGRSTRCWR